MNSVLGIFARHWTPGQVKTRLAARIGAEGASRLHRQMVATLTRRFQNAADARVLAVTPSSSIDEFAELAGPAWLILDQGSGDLGRRMEHFISGQLAAGADRVVLIGSDSPTLPADLIRDALLRLAERDVVLAPSDDGGYCLVGAARGVPPIFRDVDWGTSAVWQQTMARLAAAGTSYDVLPEWYDVDRWEDLLRLKSELIDRGDDEDVWDALRDEVNRWTTA